MRYRMLDINGDYSFGKGQQNITYGTYAVAQAIKTRLKLLKEEWWEDKEDGLPLFQQILGAMPNDNNMTIIDSIIKERILNTTDVLSIDEFKGSYEDRTYSFTSKVTTKYGIITVSNTI